MNFNRLYNKLIRTANTDGDLLSGFNSVIDKGIVYSQNLGSSQSANYGIMALPNPNTTGVSEEIQTVMSGTDFYTITHVISSVETYLKYFEAINPIIGNASIIASLETYLKYDEAGASVNNIGTTSPYFGDSNVMVTGTELFLTTLNTIKQSFSASSFNELYDKGIVELNNSNLNSVDSILPNLIRDGLFTESSYNSILDKGLVLSLNIRKSEIADLPNDVSELSYFVEYFGVDYANNVLSIFDNFSGGLDYNANIVISSIETYLKYAEAVG